VLIEYKNEMGERLASYFYEALSERGKLKASPPRLVTGRNQLEREHSGVNLIKKISVLMVMSIKILLKIAGSNIVTTPD
jgi:hypothetical protein